MNGNLTDKLAACLQRWINPATDDEGTLVADTEAALAEYRACRDKFAQVIYMIEELIQAERSTKQ